MLILKVIAYFIEFNDKYDAASVSKSSVLVYMMFLLRAKVSIFFGRVRVRHK